MTISLFPLSPELFPHYRDRLSNLLRICIDDGASLGFVWPLSDQSIAMYWDDVQAQLKEGTRWVWIATIHGELIGSVQLELATKPNARHRAELQKLLVHPLWRRQGLGRALVSKVEHVALCRDRTLIMLDTQRHSAGDALYRRMGYTEAGRVPQFFYATDGHPDTTVIYYKHLAEVPSLVA
jgi:GNAT superfamily N-acetyltransferase